MDLTFIILLVVLGMKTFLAQPFFFFSQLELFYHQEVSQAQVVIQSLFAVVHLQSLTSSFP